MKKYDNLISLLEAFPDEKSCIQHLEQLRWPKGIVCPCCGSSRKIYKVTRDHIYKCSDCNLQFSVRKGTIFEESRLPLRKWFMAVWLVTSSRKGISSCQLSREIGVTQKTAWFILGRLREIAGEMGKLGGPLGGTIEADETYVGGKESNKHKEKKLKAGRGTIGKFIVMGAYERRGRIKTELISGTDRTEIHRFITETVNPESKLYTDNHSGYVGLSGYQHASVNHSIGQYVNGNIHTNSIESFWAILKRSYYGVFHKMTAKHIHRYLAEFEARWDMKELRGGDRFDKMLEFSPGLRLKYNGLIS